MSLQTEFSLLTAWGMGAPRDPCFTVAAPAQGPCTGAGAEPHLPRSAGCRHQMGWRLAPEKACVLVCWICQGQCQGGSPGLLPSHHHQVKGFSYFPSPKTAPRSTQKKIRGVPRDIHCCLVHNSQDMEAIQKSIKGGMDEEDVVCIYSRILLSHKKE